MIGMDARAAVVKLPVAVTPDKASYAAVTPDEPYGDVVGHVAYLRCLRRFDTATSVFV